MAAIIEIPSAQTNVTIYSTIANLSGQRWNGTAFESFNGANWSNYVTALTEDRYSGSGSGYYKGNFPNAIVPGKYSFSFYQQLGGSPAFGDPNIGSGQIYWNGTTEEQGVYLSALPILNTLAMTELTGVPGATPTVFQALMLMYMSLKNIHTATGAQESIYNNAGSPITNATLNDNGSVFTKGQFT